MEKNLAIVELDNDPFLDALAAESRPSIFVCFAQAFRDGEFSRGNKTDLAAGTVHEAMDQVSAVFEDNERSHPFKSARYKVDF